MLASLEAVGAIQQDRQTEKYHLGLKLFELGHRVPLYHTFAQTTRPALKEVAQKIRETVHLAILKGDQIFYVDKVESPLGLKISTQIGSFRPAHCTSLGKVLLAYCAEEQLGNLWSATKLPRFTPYSIADPLQLREALGQVRAAGYAIDREEFEIGLICVAVPIFNQAGAVVAALSASGPANRFREESVGEYVAILREGAGRIQQSIGYLTPQTISNG